MRTMRALLLARKSNKVKLNATERGEGLSLETQDEVARAFADAQGWPIVDTAGDTVSGRKVKPSERKNLGPWLTEPTLIAQWDVLVAAKGDRISRERIEYWAELEAWCVAHGKTLVVCERGGVYFPPRHEGDTYNWAGIKSMAGQEWDVIRGRIVQSQCAIMRGGYWVGRAPWGYRISGDRYRKSLVATPEAAYVAAIYSRAIAGESLRKIAAWLESEGVKTDRGNAVWNEGVIQQILTNATYSGTGTRSCAECNGSHDVTVPALVDMATQRRAGEALRRRVRRPGADSGRPSAAPAMLVPYCEACSWETVTLNGPGGKPVKRFAPVAMYRTMSGHGASRYAAYYCKSRTVGGVRKGCGLMVACEVADALADAALSADARDEMTVSVSYPAAALESEIERVRRAERSAFEADDITKMLELRSQRETLTAELADAETERVEEIPTGRKIGQVWSELDPSERRSWLTRRGIRVFLTKTRVGVHMPLDD